MNRINYYEIPGFENVYLEDSYILNIIDSGRDLIFMLDMVLTESHPYYSPPKHGEQYCFRRSNIIFEKVIKLQWIKKIMRAYDDASGEKDYGNIDLFYSEDSSYHLEGSWGILEVTSQTPYIKLL